MLSSAVLVLAASLVVGQTDAEKTYKGLADFLVGGVWVYKADDGTLVEHAYRRILEGRFLQNTASAVANGAPAITIVGIDSLTGEVTFWWFAQDGQTGISRVTSKAPGIWLFKGESKGAKGREVIEFTANKVNQDELRVDIISLTVNGIKQDGKPEIWKRRK